MKKTQILLLIAVFITTQLQAQQRPGNNAQFEAGTYLKKFSKQYFTGIGLMAGGYFLAIVGTAASVNSTNGTSTSTSNSGGIILVGSLAALGGTILTIVSHRNIGKAGEQLMISSQSLGFEGQRLNSIGWAFNIHSRKKNKRLRQHLIAWN